MAVHANINIVLSKGTKEGNTVQKTDLHLHTLIYIDTQPIVFGAHTGNYPTCTCEIRVLNKLNNSC